MYKAAYFKSDGTEGQSRDLPEWLFDGVVHEHALYLAVKAYLANQRQGTASAKTRGEVEGGNRKPWRQKGTGRARQGSIRAPHWEGGGVVFPPVPRDWREKLPKKVKSLARRSAFNARAEENRVLLIDPLVFDVPKTARLRDYLRTIQTQGKVLLLTDGYKKEVYLSARNLPEVRVLPFGDEAPFDILWANTVVIERTALERAGIDSPQEPTEPNGSGGAAHA